ncbi:Calcium release activated channel regulator [Mactra antiquata]
MPLLEKDCDATYKVLILGDASVGKTALLRCLTGKEFHDRLLPTIATDFVKKTFEVDGAIIELQIWDTAGQERFHSMNRWQYRGVKGVVMVYDVTDQSTFNHLFYWLKSVNEEMEQTHNKYDPVPIVLLGNKSDLESGRKVKLKDGQQLADKELAFEFLETSAKTGKNVYDAFRKLAFHVTEICNPNVMKSYHPYMIRERTSQGQNEKSVQKRPRDKKTIFQRFGKHNKPKQKKSKVDNSATFIEMQTFNWCENDTMTTSFSTQPTKQTQKDSKNKRRARFKCCCFG